MDDRGKKSKKATNRSRLKGRRSSPEADDTMGKPRQDASPSGSRDVSGKELTGAKRKQPKRERWLLTRKTWRYMADAGRRLIPEGAHNRAEDVPKIEAYFQEVCHREPRFLLWRKSSYPGALAFRAHRKRQRKKGGSYREKASSADEADELRAAALGAKGVVGLGGSTPSGSMQMTPSSSMGRFDLQRLRKEFLQGNTGSPPSPTSISRPMLVNKQTPGTQKDEEEERRWFIDTLCRYLNREEAAEAGIVSQEEDTTDYQMLVEQLRKHMSSLSLCSESEDGGSVAGSTSSLHKTAGSVTAGGTGSTSRWIGARPPPHCSGVPFTGDIQQQKLLDTFQRFYSKSTNRQKVISDLLTDRKLLEKLYFDLRQTRGFGGRRDGSGFDRETAGLDFQLRRREMAAAAGAGAARIRSTTEADETGFPGAGRGRQRRRGDPTFAFASPPPLIEVQDEGDGSCDVACQTPPVCAETFNALEEHLRRERERQEEEGGSGGASPRGGANRRRSSVDHDDVSPSVSDTIKRYLRMARKKSMDGDKADRFKRVNYDRNLRNIKAKGETTKPGDDDGLSKGAQTDLAWVDAMRELKVASVAETDVESEVTMGAATGTETPRGGRSSRCSSIEGEASPSGAASPSTPHASRGIFASGQTFLAGLLHGLQHAASTGADATGGGGGVSAGAAVPKSKSTSSMVQQGSRLVAKKLWKRSTSTGRSAAAAQPVACTWTSQGRCTWSNHEGRIVTLSDTPLLHLSELERLVLVKVAVAKLQALNLGVTVRVPSESVAGPSVQKPKRRRPYLLKGGRRALTTGIFDTGRSRDADKDKGSEGGLVFGIPLAQCLENDRIAIRAGSGSVDAGSAAGSVGSVGGVTGSGVVDPVTGPAVAGLRRQSHHGSRASFTSLIEMATSQRPDGSGSCESLAATGSGGGGGGAGSAGLPRAAGSVPGLLDSLSSCGGSTSELLSAGSVGGSGMAGDTLMGATIPRLLNACFRHLERFGLDTIGLFRVSTSKKRVRQLREEFDCGKDVALGEEHCPHDVATLLKEFLRDLPEPLLSRDLYHAFVQTQRIRNRRLQFEALQHLVQLLPPANRDTLHGLLTFLSTVAAHAGDRRNADGEWVSGNKMDTSNLATVIAPNVLHCLKAGAQEVSAERAEERIDVINVVRALIDHHRALFTVPADLLDEVYLHLMDSHPDTLDQLLRQRDAQADDFGDDLESGCCSELTSPVDAEAPTPVAPTPTPPSQGVVEAPSPPRRVWSREEFLHESAATGGPDLAMRQSKHRERSRTARKRWSEDASGTGGAASTAGAGAGRRRATDGDTRASTESPTPPSPTATDHGVITASLKIPVPPSALTMDDVDIPFIEDGIADAGARQQMTFGPGGLVRSGSSSAAAAVAAARKQRRARTASGGSDSSQASPLGTGQTDSALGSSCATYSSPQRNTPSVASGSDGPYSSPPSWASSPPTSPDAGSEDVASARLSFASKVSPIKGPGVAITSKEAAPVILQKVTFTSTSELKQVHRSGTAENAPASLAGRTTDQQLDYATYASPSRDVRRTRASSPTASSSPAPHASPSKPSTLALDLHESSGSALDRKLTTSISSIGGAVMRSKTADIERMLRLQKTEQQRPASKVDLATAPQPESQDKKKYTKRRYTDSRHQTRLIPDAEALADGSGMAASAAKTSSTTASSSSSTSGASATQVSEAAARKNRVGPVWKRRELIASDPKRHE